MTENGQFLFRGLILTICINLWTNARWVIVKKYVATQNRKARFIAITEWFSSSSSFWYLFLFDLWNVRARLSAFSLPGGGLQYCAMAPLHQGWNDTKGSVSPGMLRGWSQAAAYLCLLPFLLAKLRDSNIVGFIRTLWYRKPQQHNKMDSYTVFLQDCCWLIGIYFPGGFWCHMQEK